MAAECVPIADDTLVVLADDLSLQNAENVLPAINSKTALDLAIGQALDEVSKVLDTPTLVALNKRVVVDLDNPKQVAADFIADKGITAPTKSSGKLVVGSANWYESNVLAEIYAQVLTDAGFDVKIRTFDNREIYMDGLISGEIDVFPEYAASAAEFLNLKQNGADAAPVASGDTDATVAALRTLGDEVGVTFGMPSAAQDANTFATTKAFADKWGVSTLSELADTCGPIPLGGPVECPERPFCQVGLENTYGIEISEFSALDTRRPADQVGDHGREGRPWAGLLVGPVARLTLTAHLPAQPGKAKARSSRTGPSLCVRPLGLEPRTL